MLASAIVYERLPFRFPLRERDQPFRSNLAGLATALQSEPALDTQRDDQVVN